MKSAIVLCGFVFLALGVPTASRQSDEMAVQISEVSKLDYLVGEWITESVVVRTDVKAPGKLSYRKILGGSYILCQFKGEMPGRQFWEAYAMITYDPAAGHYRSYAFFGGAAPARYVGEWTDENTATFTNLDTRPDGSKDRINYTRMPDGAVFQLNEAKDEQGNWQPTLRTTYSPAK